MRKLKVWKRCRRDNNVPWLIPGTAQASSHAPLTFERVSKRGGKYRKKQRKAQVSWPCPFETFPVFRAQQAHFNTQPSAGSRHCSARSLAPTSTTFRHLQGLLLGCSFLLKPLSNLTDLHQYKRESIPIQQIFHHQAQSKLSGPAVELRPAAILFLVSPELSLKGNIS